MKLALLYPPPWKIPEAGKAPDPLDGPPDEFQPGDLDADFYQTPYGLYSLATQALHAGHQVKLYNLSGYAWREVETVLDQLDADVFGMSCWTANRRGVKLVADAIRRRRPAAHIVVGGPHATPLPEDVLKHYGSIDTVVIGEGELTLLDILERLERGSSVKGVPGTAYRDGEQILLGPPRAAIEDLDSLVSPHRHFTTHILMTSRGCPWQCTFCGAEASWGRGFRGQSVGYVLDAIEQAVARLPVKMLQIKDDTFTTNKKRVIELCRGIRKRKLNFLWSCDTRVDVLSEELLKEMRLAGCQRLSLGVESGSPAILKNINKRITVDKIVASANMAKKYGVHVRFYMMLGNRGETRETFHETLEFLKEAAPHQYIFSCLSVYPGTLDFDAARDAGWLSSEDYFEGKFQELKIPFDASPEDTALLLEWFRKNKGVQNRYLPSVDECQAALEQLGSHHAAHLDLAGAYFREGQLQLAKQHAQRSLELELPVPGLADNLLACIAFAENELRDMMDLFMQAAKRDPQHPVLVQNIRSARQWFKDRGPELGLPLTLNPSHQFSLLERTQQPALPGPLSDDFSVWSPPLDNASADVADQAAARDSDKRHLQVLSS